MSTTNPTGAAAPAPAEQLLRDRARAILLVAIVALATFAYRELIGWNPGRSLAEEAPDLFVASNTSPLFIGGLSVLFLYLRFGRLRRAARASTPNAWGWALLLPALGLYIWGLYTDAPDLLLLSFIPGTLGASLVLVGAPFTRVLLLPVLFLIFAYPVPAVLANQQVYAFQSGTASLSTWVLQLLGFDATLEGDLIYTRGGVFEVIETCSGLRITETLTASAFAYSELIGTRRLHTAILVVLAPILGFLLNTVRVLLIIFNPLADPAADHTLQGIVVIVAGVISFALIERVLKAVLPASDAWPRARRALPHPRPALAGAWSVLVLVAVMGGASLWLPRWQPSQHPRQWQITMPPDWNGWQARKLERDDNFLGSVFFARWVGRRYEKNDLFVDTFMAKDDRLKRDRSIVSPKTALPGGGWMIQESRTTHVDWAPLAVEEIVATRRGQRVLIYHWREGMRPFRRESLRALLALESSFLRDPGELRVFRVSTPLSSRPGGLERARARLDEFAPAVRGSIELSSRSDSAPATS